MYGSFQNALFGVFFVLNIDLVVCHSQYSSVEVGGEIYKKCYLSRI